MVWGFGYMDFSIQPYKESEKNKDSIGYLFQIANYHQLEFKEIDLGLESE